MIANRLLQRGNLWTPLSETGAIWWDPAVTTGSGASLSVLDRGTNAYHATIPGTVTVQQTIATNVIDGNPVMRFVASNSQYFTMAPSTALVGVNSPFTFVVVAKRSAVLGSGFGALCNFVSNVGSALFTSFFVANQVNYGALNIGGGTATSDTCVGITSFNYYSNFFAFTAVYDGTGSFSTASKYSWQTNGSANNPTNRTGTTNSALALSTIGSYGGPTGGLYWDGDIADIILFPTAFDAGKLALLNAWLHTKYPSII